MTQWYIEAKPGESWREASRSFVEWVKQQHVELKTFGFSEGDPIRRNDICFHCFYVPDHHGENVDLFKAWAATVARAHGRAEGRAALLSNGEKLVLPDLMGASPPPWLK